jgi:hypothetical protein
LIIISRGRFFIFLNNLYQPLNNQITIPAKDKTNIISPIICIYICSFSIFKYSSQHLFACNIFPLISVPSLCRYAISAIISLSGNRSSQLPEVLQQFFQPAFEFIQCIFFIIQLHKELQVTHCIIFYFSKETISSSSEISQGYEGISEPGDIAEGFSIWR